MCGRSRKTCSASSAGCVCWVHLLFCSLLVWGLVIEKYYVDELVLQKGEDLSFIFQVSESQFEFHFSVSWIKVWVSFFRRETELLSFIFWFPLLSITWLQKHLGKGSPTFPFAIWCWAKFKYIFPCILLPHLMPLVPVT